MDKISIVGLGLIGGSLGLAIKKYDGNLQVAGYSRRPETVRLALEKGAIDVGARNLKEAVDQARLIVIATPILTTRTVLQEIAPIASASAIVTDTGSTKSAIVEWAEAYLPREVSFVGGHPMAGKEKSGIEFAEADLFRNCVYCLTPASPTAGEAIDYVKGLVSRLQARPLVIEARKHDRLVAAISHLPFLLSVALMDLCAGDPLWPEMSRLASSGFRGVSRLASGDPVMYRDICATNAAEISSYLQQFQREMEKVKDLLNQPGELERVFQAAREARENWLKGHSRAEIG